MWSASTFLKPSNECGIWLWLPVADVNELRPFSSLLFSCFASALRSASPGARTKSTSSVLTPCSGDGFAGHLQLPKRRWLGTWTGQEIGLAKGMRHDKRHPFCSSKKHSEDVQTKHLVHVGWRPTGALEVESSAYAGLGSVFSCPLRSKRT